MTDDVTKDFPFDAETQDNLNHWLEGGYSEATKNEIRRLLKDNPQELANAFYTRVTFGTGGVRALLGVGPNRMNIYTIGAYIQGLANYLAKEPKKGSPHSVIIGYDSRNQSRDFAEYAARVLAANGIKVFIFKELRPTPLVSFGCRFKGCSAGIMITASHNPAEYSGCKIYWSDGAQLISPHDIALTEEANTIDDVTAVKTVATLSHPLIEEIGEEIDVAYCGMLSHFQNFREENQIHGSTLNIVYTSLHGAAIALTPKILSSWGFTNLHLVDQQVIPDGSFPTVAVPNPELPDTLALGISKLKDVDGDLLIAHDPDGDRVSVAVQHNGGVELLTGNELAVLLLEHICENLVAHNKLAVNAAFVKSVVTTDLFTAIVEYYQKTSFNVLPGSKYIAEKIRRWEGAISRRQFIFAAEESCGYIIGTDVREKDGISASALICEMALQAKLKGKSLVDQLHDIYRRHGVYYDELVTVSFQDSKVGRERIAKALELLQRRPPRELAGKQVVLLEDYRRSIRVDLKTHKQEPLVQPKANLVLYRLEDGSKLALRPSGTEPKLKIYCGVVCKKFSSVAEGLDDCKARAKALIVAIKEILDEDLERFANFNN